MKIKYSMSYNKNSKQWVVWQDIEKEKSIGCIPKFKGSKKECQEKLKELRIGEIKNGKSK